MEKAILRIATLGFGCGLGAGLLLALSLPRAVAAYDHLSGMVCQPALPTSAHTYVTQAYGSWIENNHATNAATFVCPLPDYTDLPATEISSINVNVYDGSVNAGVVARACAWSGDDDSTTSCGTSSSTGNAATGPFTLSLDLDFSGNYVFDSGETAYAYVALPDLDISVSRLNSIYVEN